MDQRFTIGEMAKLHNIPVKTLRYYDEIGLFKPVEVDPHTNYRYYSINQFEHLNTINYLRELGFTLNEIKQQFVVKDRQHLYDMLVRQEAQVAQEIKKLKQAKNRLNNRKRELICNFNDCGQPKVQTVPERRIAQLKQSIKSHNDLEITLKQLEKRSGLNASIFIGGVGVTRSVETLPKQVYNSIFLLLEDEDIECELETIMPKREYATLLVNRERIHPKDYEPLFDFIDKNKLKVDGDAIERTIIDRYITSDQKEHLSEIQVPVLS